jgi:hypothetical protein
MITSNARRWWFLPVISIAVIPVLVLVSLRATGIISPEPLIETHLVFSLKWGLAVAFFLQMLFAWRDHRRYFLTDALLRNLPEPGSPGIAAPARALNQEFLMRWVVLQNLKRRCTYMLGNVASGVGMLAGLYVITKAGWLLLAILIYAAAASWLWRPRDGELMTEASSP